MKSKWMISISSAALLIMNILPAHAGKVAPDLDAKTTEIIKRDFQDKGIAKADRVIQDGLQAMCSRYADKLPDKLKAMLEDQEGKSIKWPADGKFMGDWKAGEKLAQSGKGLTWSDKADEPVGGNCYNCHQLSSKEIAYGTIGPSLLNFGKIRGTSEEIQRYAYGRIYNAKANNACANMPRFGHMGILTEAQIKDLVALLLDPESPVNK
jgi:sulfur-oxidizing protein SoxX